MIVALGLAAVSYSAVANAQTYRVYNLHRFLIPAAEIPQGHAALLAKAPELLQQYPRDPRSHLYQAISLAHARDLAGAEAETRAALAERDILSTLLVPSFTDHLQAYLALVLTDQHRKDEARAFAKAACCDASAAPAQGGGQGRPLRGAMILKLSGVKWPIRISIRVGFALRMA